MEWHQLDKNSKSFWGQKANNLVKLQQLGVLIPPTWTINTDDLLIFCNVSTLQKLASFPRQDPKHYQATFTEWSEQLQKSSFPQAWQKSLGKIIEKIKDYDKVIVRSSHSFEDTAEKSFAGTYLSLVVDKNPKAIAESIQKICIQAFAISTQKQVLEAGLNPQKFRPGIILQPFVQAQRAGVFFSRNPNNPTKKECLCEWTENQNISLVEGDSNGQRTSWTKNPPKDIVLQKIAKDYETLKKEWPLLDAEWLWTGKKLYWVQARKIADTLTNIIAASGEITLDREDMKERFPEPLSRLGWSILNTIINTNLDYLSKKIGLIIPKESEIVANYNGVIYSNSNFFQLKKVKWRLSYLKRFLQPIAWFKIIADYLRHYNHKALWCKVTDLYLSSAAQSIISEWNSHQEHRTKIPDLKKTTALELAEILEDLEEKSRHVFGNDMATFVLREAYYRLLVPILQDEQAVQSILKTKRVINAKFYMDSEKVHAISAKSCNHEFFIQLDKGIYNPELLAEEDLKTWENFLDNWGAVNESWDISVPCWREDPTLLAAYFRETEAHQTKSPPCRYKEDKINSLIKHYKLQEIFNRFSNIVITDDKEHYQGAEFLNHARLTLLESGNRLVKKGIIKTQEQVFGLTLTEVKNLLKGKNNWDHAPYAAMHMSKFSRAKNTNFPDKLGEKKQIKKMQGHSLSGLPVSPGKIIGTLLLVNNSNDFKCIKENTIIAVHNPNPVFIPILSRVSGLICESGGLLAHSFVVCREIALPAITQLKGIFENFKSGDQVEVDGDAGLLRRVE